MPAGIFTVVETIVFHSMMGNPAALSLSLVAAAVARTGAAVRAEAAEVLARAT